VLLLHPRPLPLLHRPLRHRRRHHRHRPYHAYCDLRRHHHPRLAGSHSSYDDSQSLGSREDHPSCRAELAEPPSPITRFVKEKKIPPTEWHLSARITRITNFAGREAGARRLRKFFVGMVR
jgi:hypothetical protein